MGSEVGRFRQNRDGTARGWRFFLLLVAGLLLSFLAFVGLVLASPAPGIRQNASVYAILGVLPVVLAFVGFWLTLGRAPRGLLQRPGEVVVVERMGKRRRIPWPSPLKQVTRYPASPLAPGPTQIVEVEDELGARRTYLVGMEFFEFDEGPTVGPS